MKQTNKKESYDPKQELKYVSRECFVWLWLSTIGLKQLDPKECELNKYNSNCPKYVFLKLTLKFVKNYTN